MQFAYSEWTDRALHDYLKYNSFGQPKRVYWRAFEILDDIAGSLRGSVRSVALLRRAWLPRCSAGRSDCGYLGTAYECQHCYQWTCWCDGGADDGHNVCDACWAELYPE